MRSRIIPAGLVMACLLWPQSGAAQTAPASQPAPTTAELKKDIETLRQALQAIQKDLQDIKALLQARPAAQQATAQPQNVLLDVANHPTRGEQTAKLTLVEFSDYQ